MSAPIAPEPAPPKPSEGGFRDPVAPWRLLEDYRPLAGVYDEMSSAAGQPRQHCQGLLRSLEGLGRTEWLTRWEGARRAIRDNGVTYNVYNDPQGVDRPWTLDMLPLLIEPAEWSRIEGGLLQRSRLLNVILADLYGPQRLLREGLLPPSLVLANPSFLRPCHGVPVPNDIYVHLLAVDLGRSPDGQWRVIADRAQAPSGAGYALENRIVMSRSLPEAFRDCHVQRLGAFFRAHRDGLMALAPPDRRDHPRVVLLTPGPLNETYFEHAYLARYLGFTLVEGADLTVRDSRVFIKTLEGLRQVDVILRRLDDSFCDPLELRSDSALGVAGLVEAVRSGHVTMANALGSGLVEAAGVSTFLPDLCRHLLGEELLLHPARSWWCGHPDELQYVLAHLDELVIKPSFPPASRQPIFGRTLSAEQKSLLRSSLLARPEEYVAQSEVALSTAPAWTGTGAEARQLVLRVYVATNGESTAVMPGGLTRVGAAGNLPIVSMQRGGGSKDTWIVSEGPVTAVTLLAPMRLSVRRERLDAELPSRVADNLFWLGRHVERAEQTVRLLRSLVSYLTRGDTVEEVPELVALLHVLADMELVPPQLRTPMPLPKLEQQVSMLFRADAQGGTLRATLGEVRRIAAMVRDRLSLDTWRILNQLQLDSRLRHGRLQIQDVLAHLNRMITDLAAFSGMESESMTRGHGWLFLDIGRRLERSLAITRLIRSALTASPSHVAMLEPLLEVADSAMTYRRRYFAEAQLPPVLDLLLSDGTNPRALRFQLDTMAALLSQLPRDPRAPSPTHEEQRVRHAIEALAAADFDALSQPGADAAFEEVTALLDLLDEDLRGVSDTVTYHYFSHAEQRVN
jgi:uncharacterized circularly permuted ATP-grasp superfamily protein/uncharacterized alpha-E superfamily protein